MGQAARNTGVSAATVPAGFAAAIASDPTLPLLTWYDDASGDRTELSGATLANWVAKTANLLVDGAGLQPGDPVGVLLPPHWQTAAVLLGSWSAGATVVPTENGTVDVLFATVELGGDTPAGERYALGLAPMAAPLRTVPEGFADYVVEVRVFGDRFAPYAPVQPDDVALDLSTTTTHAELCLRAAERASEWGVGPGDRVLIDADRFPDPVDWLLTTLLTGASLVLCGHLDPDRLAARVTAERVTRQPAP